jgi:hypothetical protein
MTAWYFVHLLLLLAQIVKLPKGNLGRAHSNTHLSSQPFQHHLTQRSPYLPAAHLQLTLDPLVPWKISISSLALKTVPCLQQGCRSPQPFIFKGMTFTISPPTMDPPSLNE